MTFFEMERNQIDRYEEKYVYQPPTSFGGKVIEALLG